MLDYVNGYYKTLTGLISRTAVTGARGRALPFDAGVAAAARLLRERTAAGSKIIFIGNGASAAISSHQAADYWKNGGMRALTFNDAAGLTCVSNDIGYDYVFEKPVAMFADRGDVLVAISSSGRSPNVLRAARLAAKLGCRLVTLSGFKPGNPLRKLGELNFHVPSTRYGHVEILHHSICHCILELIIDKAGRRGRKN